MQSGLAFRRSGRCFFLALFGGVLTLYEGGPVRAASPSSGTIDGSSPVAWDYGPVGAEP